MKNFILLLVVALMSSSVLAGDCLNGTCRQPVKRVVSSVADVTRTVVSAPVNVARKVSNNVQSRRFARRSNR